MNLKGKTSLLSGGSRGIGLAIAKCVAGDGASVALAAKTGEPHPVLPGTIYTAAEAIEAAGGRALPPLCDGRDEGQIAAAVEKTMSTFGSIDVLVLNASAISLDGTLAMPTKRFDLMSSINAASGAPSHL